MFYDNDFRYRRALDPEGLTILSTASLAVEDAIREARSAGLDPERDPAVQLLARHLGRLACGNSAEQRHDADLDLRARCFDRIAKLRANPIIVALARRGVGYDPEAKRTFLREAGRLLRLVADEFDERAVARVTTDQSGRCAAISLETPRLWVRLATDQPTPGREITYRRNDQHGLRCATADITAIIDPAAFARKLAREFHLTLAPRDVLV